MVTASSTIFAASSGIITTTASLDFESQSNYNLIVTVTDDGSPPLSFAVFMTIFILDENDNAPQYTEQSYTASVMENAAMGTFVADLSASDADSGTNAEIFYSLVGTDQNSVFRIDNTSGFVLVVRPEALDYEIESSRMTVLQVQAQDRGTPSTSSQTIVRYTLE